MTYLITTVSSCFQSTLIYVNFVFIYEIIHLYLFLNFKCGNCHIGIRIANVDIKVVGKKLKCMHVSCTVVYIRAVYYSAEITAFLIPLYVIKFGYQISHLCGACIVNFYSCIKQLYNCPSFSSFVMLN